MENQPTESSPIFLRSLVLEAVLGGCRTTDSIMRHIGLSDPAVERNVGKLLRDPAFQRESEKALDQIDERVIKWFKSRGLGYAQKMHELTSNSDPRVGFQATKDILDRMGTGPAQKVAVSGLDSYRALLKELQPDKEETSGERADAGNQGGAKGNVADDGV